MAEKQKSEELSQDAQHVADGNPQLAESSHVRGPYEMDVVAAQQKAEEDERKQNAAKESSKAAADEKDGK